LIGAACFTGDGLANSWWLWWPSPVKGMVRDDARTDSRKFAFCFFWLKQADNRVRLFLVSSSILGVLVVNLF
jgi:hypothetical protein